MNIAMVISEFSSEFSACVEWNKVDTPHKHFWINHGALDALECPTWISHEALEALELSTWISSKAPDALERF